MPVLRLGQHREKIRIETVVGEGKSGREARDAFQWFGKGRRSMTAPGALEIGGLETGVAGAANLHAPRLMDAGPASLHFHAMSTGPGREL